MPPSAAFAKGEMLRASFEEPKLEGFAPGLLEASALPLPLSPSLPQRHEKGPKYLPSLRWPPRQLTAARSLFSPLQV